MDAGSGLELQQLGIVRCGGDHVGERSAVLDYQPPDRVSAVCVDDILDRAAKLAQLDPRRRRYG
jgi:hypothetical protein